MLEDIILDTNVLMHADNPVSGRQEASEHLIILLSNSTTIIYVDRAGRIRLEYREYLVPGSVGSAFVSAMVRRSQLVAIEIQARPEDRRWIWKNINDPCDRAFLRVAVASKEKVLTSHDFDDFHNRKRSAIRRRLRVSVETAESTIYRL